MYRRLSGPIRQLSNLLLKGVALGVRYVSIALKVPGTGYRICVSSLFFHHSIQCLGVRREVRILRTSPRPSPHPETDSIFTFPQARGKLLDPHTVSFDPDKTDELTNPDDFSLSP